MISLNILIVEDESIVAKDIQNILNRLGYSAYSIVSRGKDAIKKAAETQPDLIMMDIKLKDDMDGIETAEQIRSRFCIPVIYMSALSDEDSLKRARKTEPFFFISKPVEESELKVTIEKAYSLQNTRSKSRRQK